MRNWQIILVAVVLVTAYFIDFRFFGILAAVAVATVVFSMFHRRGHHAEALEGGLRQGLTELLGAETWASDEPLLARWQETVVELRLKAFEDTRGLVRAAVEIRIPMGTRLPFCFMVQRRNAPVELPELVSNAAVFDVPFECELSQASLGPPELDDAWELMTSGSQTMGILLDSGLRAAMSRLSQTARDHALLVLRFDGTGTYVLTLPEDAEAPRDTHRALLDDAVAVHRQVAEGLANVQGRTAEDT